MPTTFKTRVRTFFNFLFARQYGIMESELLSANLTIPSYIRLKVMKSFANNFHSVPYFCNADARLTELCLDRMTFRAYCPGSVLVREGEKKRELILILSGRVEISMNYKKSELSYQMDEHSHKEDDDDDEEDIGIPFLGINQF